MRRAWVGLGGNLGDVDRAFDAALDTLAGTPGLHLREVSRRYRTPAWGPYPQPDFLNAVAGFEISLDPIDLLGILQAIECSHGRQRSQEVRFGPRTLDLDLLAVEGVVLDMPGLQLPHPRLAERAFVLVPWADIAPDLVIPGFGRIASLRDALDCLGIEAIP